MTNIKEQATEQITESLKRIGEGSLSVGPLHTIALLTENEVDWATLTPIDNIDDELRGRVWGININTPHPAHDITLTFYYEDDSDVELAVQTAQQVWNAINGDRHDS